LTVFLVLITSASETASSSVLMSLIFFSLLYNESKHIQWSWMKRNRKW